MILTIPLWKGVVIIDTSMLKRFFAAWMLFLIASCSSATPSINTPATVQIDDEELAVYGFLLSEMYTHSGYVIMNTTATSETGVENTNQTVEYVLQNLHGVDPTTVTSFKDRNASAHRLKADMAIGNPYTLLTQTSRNEIFSVNQSGWDIFYSRFPDAPGITTFSKVGFNSTLDQALIYMGTNSNWQVGEGYYLLLQKANGGWTINQKVLVWES